MKLALLPLFALFFATEAEAQQDKLLIGTYTNKGTSEGIYVYDFDRTTAETKLKSVAKNVINPSYLAISKDKKFVYSVNEAGKNSEVSAFSFNMQSGELTFLNKNPSAGADPCFITVDDKNVILANYGGGNISVFGRNADGSLGPIKQVVQHTGKSIDPKKRQESAHVHQVQFTPDHKYLISNDLGEDNSYIYNYNPQSTDKVLTQKAVIKTNPGTGPRHLTFGKNGQFAYLVHEFNGSITVFSYHKGNLDKIQEIGTAAKDFTGRIDGADLHISPDGKFLYETNRGDANTITAFSILPNGNLKFIETIPTLGRGPRNFAIDPSGNFLLIAHQYTNDVVIFNRDPTRGTLKDSGKRINVGTPVCLLFTQN
ncbi:MAG: lactonase family protein [Bacteroidota bacterium]